MDHIRLARQLPGPGGHAGHDDALADVEPHLWPDHFDAIAEFVLFQALVEARSEDGHLVTTRNQRARLAFRVDGQTRIVRAVVGQSDQDVHNRYSDFPGDVNEILRTSRYRPASDCPSRARA